MEHSFIKGFSVLFGFDFGIPNVCRIRIGDEIEDGWHNAVQDRNTGDYEFDRALSEYRAFVDCDLDYGDTVKEILITLPFSDWNYEDIKSLYAYTSKEFLYETRNASYSFDNDNDLSEVDILLSNSLYEISIFDKERDGHKYLKIMISQKREDATIYQALNTLVTIDENNPIVFSTLKEILASVETRKQ